MLSIRSSFCIILLSFIVAPFLPASDYVFYCYGISLAWPESQICRIILLIRRMGSKNQKFAGQDFHPCSHLIRKVRMLSG
jgi:hypothetical protein